MAVFCMCCPCVYVTRLLVVKFVEGSGPTGATGRVLCWLPLCVEVAE